MELTPVLKYLHILSMFASSTLAWAPDLFFWRAARARDFETMRRVGALGKTVVNIGIALFFVGLAFGVATALVAGIDLTAGWLLTAYGLILALVVLGAGIENPHFLKIAAEVERTGDVASPELERLLRSPIRYLLWVSVALWAAVIYVMVAKPFS